MLVVSCGYGYDGSGMRNVVFAPGKRSSTWHIQSNCRSSCTAILWPPSLINNVLACFFQEDDFCANYVNGYLTFPFS